MTPPEVHWYPEADDRPARFAPARPGPTMDTTPRLSCLLPTRDGGMRLIHCATALAEVLGGFGLPWEIVVLDHGSQDGSATWAREWAKGPGYRLGRFALHCPRRRLLNLGLLAARGDLVLLLDPALPDALERARQTLALGLAGARLVLWAGDLCTQPAMRRPRARPIALSEPEPLQLMALDPALEAVLLLDRPALDLHLRHRA